MAPFSSPAQSHPNTSSSTLWVQIAAIGFPTGFALLLYWISAAPGLTWAHNGADGGDLLAAAMVNGVAHPTGYPLYTGILRFWLWLSAPLSAPLSAQLGWPPIEVAYWGNRFSALCMAGAVAFTVTTAAHLLRQNSLRWLWAAVAAFAFAVTPLAWSQALITEVYSLYALLIATTGWTALNRRVSDLFFAFLLGLSAAHHLTLLLLWPALFYWRFRDRPRHQWLGASLRIVGVALPITLLLYGSLLWRISTATTPPAIAWGYPRDLSGLWWLVSGAAYRSYLFDMTPLQYVGRLASVARLLVEQFTPLGLAFVIGGFAVWDRQRPLLRNGALLWVLPITLYAAGYNTVDSYIYLLPVVWLMALLLAQGMESSYEWLLPRIHATPRLVTTLITATLLVALVALTLWRMPQLDLRNDRAAQEYIDEAAQTLAPAALVISSADAPTFALWYGQWGSGQLAQALPDLVFVNHALYQFGWYRDLMHDLYPEVPKMGAPFNELIAANRALRPIYFTEPLAEISPVELTPDGAFWRLNGP